MQLLMSGARAAGQKVAECRALWQAGATLLEAGRWREAEPPLTQALSILEALLGAGHLDIARACNSLAIIYYKVSLSCFRRSNLHVAFLGAVIHLLHSEEYSWQFWGCIMDQGPEQEPILYGTESEFDTLSSGTGQPD